MKKKILFVLSLLFGLMFINAGLNKFLNYMPPPEDMPEALMNDFQAIMEIALCTSVSQKIDSAYIMQRSY